MKSRLLDIMMNATIIPDMNKTMIECCAEAFADELIANGIILPSFKVGDTVWVYDEFMWGIIPCTVNKPYCCIGGKNDSCTFEIQFTEDDVGKIVFYTKEEAECVAHYKKEENFKKFLELSEDKRFEYLTGNKLNWFQRMQIKHLNKWWTSIQNANPHLKEIDLWESIYKGRF